MGCTQSDLRPLLIGSAVSLALFALIAAGVAYVPAVSQFDRAIADGLHGHAAISRPTVDAFLQITWLGTARAFLGLSLAVMAAAVVLRHWRFAAAWAVVLVIGGALIQQSKLYFGRARPSYNGVFSLEDSYSFPSGHALSSLVGYGLLAYALVLLIRTRGLQRTVIWLCAAIIVAIGFSRLYLGVHWFSDVLGGYALGLAWLLFSVALIEEVRRLRANSPARPLQREPVRSGSDAGM